MIFYKNYENLVNLFCSKVMSVFYLTQRSYVYTIFYQVQCSLFYIEKVVEIFAAHYTWNIAGKGFKMAFIRNKLAMINSFEFILEK